MLSARILLKLTFLPELRTEGCRFLPRADWCQKSLQNDTVDRKNMLVGSLCTAFTLTKASEVELGCMQV